MKDDVLAFIRGFSNITIKDVCSSLKVDKDNLYRGRCSLEKTILVADEIIKRYNLILENYKKVENK